MSKSEQFRSMYDGGMTVSQIAKETNSNHAFVYSVIRKHIGEDGELRSSKPSGSSKSEEFRKMYDNGMSIGEIAKITNSNYSFVFSIIKKYRESANIRENSK